MFLYRQSYFEVFEVSNNLVLHFSLYYTLKIYKIANVNQNVNRIS